MGQLLRCVSIPPFDRKSRLLTNPTENYLQNAPGGEVPGALGLHQAAASNIVNALIIGSYITPVPAAVIADSWLGRYKTMLYAAMYSGIPLSFLFFSFCIYCVKKANKLTALNPSGQRFYLRLHCPSPFTRELLWAE